MILLSSGIRTFLFYLRYLMYDDHCKISTSQTLAIIILIYLRSVNFIKFYWPEFCVGWFEVKVIDQMQNKKIYMYIKIINNSLKYSNKNMHSNLGQKHFYISVFVCLSCCLCVRLLYKTYIKQIIIKQKHTIGFVC